MMKLQTKLMLLLGIGALALLPGAKADERNQKTIFTFSGPVEIPGQVLPGGSYVFKLHDSPSNRHIVQVFNEEENHVFGTFLAIPDYRMHPTSEPLINFHERAEGAPPAIKAWFYPGRNYGHELVYPRNKAVALAAANHTPVPSMPTELAADAAKPDVALDAPEVAELTEAPLTAAKPTGEEIPLSDAFLMTLPAVPAASELPDALPDTASPLPIMALSGVLLMGAGLAIRLAAPKSN
jgi:hypothetical protein